MNIVVGVSDCRVSKERRDVLLSYALGSGAAVIIHDSIAGVGGLLHFMLPESPGTALLPAKSPYTYAATGIPLLFHEAYRNGAMKNRLKVWLVGGAQVLGSAEIFHIGQRNCLATRSILWKAGVMLRGEATGGRLTRSVRLDISSGKVYLKALDEVEEREL